MHQLECVNRKFEVDQAAWTQLDVEWAGRPFVPGHVVTHLRRVGSCFCRIVRRTEDRANDLAKLVALLGRTVNRARTAKRHMLPGPSFAPLVFGETFQRDGEHSLAALRA